MLILARELRHSPEKVWQALTDPAHLHPKSARLGFWLSTSFFSLMMAFTAYNELASPQVAEAFAHLGFPSQAFRVELSVAKVLGVLALLLPVPDKAKEWAYAAFTINLGSALFAHLAAGDDASQWVWSVGFWALLGVSYFFRRRLRGASTLQKLA